MDARPSLAALPTEILEAIFLNLDPSSLVSVSQTSKFIKKITTDAPVIWRHFCLTRFKSWARHHHISAKLAGPLSSVDWRGLYIERVNIEKNTRRLLDKVLERQQHRFKHINEIAEFGYDAKETLLKECACPDDAEDVLARRYYANAILERIQREMAITAWKDLCDGQPVPLEKALGAYDLFTRTGEDVDFDVITSDLDNLARQILAEHPTFGELSTRQKASVLANFMRDQGFRGVGDVSYHALQNSFIGFVLRSPEHESLPPITVGIYCALASRLGLDARPCGMIFHIYCLVYAPKDYDLDGKYKPTSSTDLDFMYLDPFRSSHEVDQNDLLRTLRDMGVAAGDRDAFLTHTTTREMAMRTARNIMNSVQMIRHTEIGDQAPGQSMHAYPDTDSAFYAAIWAFLMLSGRETEVLPHGEVHTISTRRRQYLPYLLDHFNANYPWEVSLLEKYIIPLFNEHPERERLYNYARAIYQEDSLRKPIIDRSPALESQVRFKVGQLFKHERYGYEGVITGWDRVCSAGEEWIQHMGVDRLPKGRKQSFYHVL
jgi:F-box protein 21